MGAHAYDTGAALPQRTRVRNAVMNRLAPLLKANGRYMREIVALPRRYRGEGDEDGKQLLVNALLGQAPAIGVALGRKTYEAADLEAFTVTGEIEVSIAVVSQHERDPSAVTGRLSPDIVGDASLTADPGIEAALEHIEELLLGQGIGIDDAAEMRASDEEEVTTAANGSIWQQTYTIKVERQINPSRGNTLITSIENRNQPDGIPDTDPDSDSDLNPLVTTVTALPPPVED